MFQQCLCIVPITLLLFRKGGMAHTAELALCVPLVEPLLDFGGWLAPLSPPLCLGVYWIDRHLQIFPAIIFLLSVSSLHICFLSQMVVVLILYTSQPYGRMTHPVGKSYASIVDDEKLAFLGGMNIKIPLPSS